MEPNNPPPTAPSNWERRLKRIFWGCALVFVLIALARSNFHTSDNIQTLLLYAAEIMAAVATFVAIPLTVMIYRRNRPYPSSWGLWMLLAGGVTGLAFFGLVITAQFGFDPSQQLNPLIAALVIAFAVIGGIGAAAALLSGIMLVIVAIRITRSRRQRAS